MLTFDRIGMVGQCWRTAGNEGPRCCWAISRTSTCSSRATSRRYAPLSPAALRSTRSPSPGRFHCSVDGRVHLFSDFKRIANQHSDQLRISRRHPPRPPRSDENSKQSASLSTVRSTSAESIHHQGNAVRKKFARKLKRRNFSTDSRLDFTPLPPLAERLECGSR